MSTMWRGGYARYQVLHHLRQRDGRARRAGELSAAAAAGLPTGTAARLSTRAAAAGLRPGWAKLQSRAAELWRPARPPARPRHSHRRRRAWVRAGLQLRDSAPAGLLAGGRATATRAVHTGRSRRDGFDVGQ